MNTVTEFHYKPCLGYISRSELEKHLKEMNDKGYKLVSTTNYTLVSEPYILLFWEEK